MQGYEPELSAADFPTALQEASLLAGEGSTSATPLRRSTRTERRCLGQSCTGFTESMPRLEFISQRRADDLPSSCPTTEDNCVYSCLAAGFTVEVRVI